MRLAEAKGDITEDRALIEELELSKKISDEIAIKLKESKVTSEKINETSEKYRPVARRGALLFFIMNDLHKMHTVQLLYTILYLKFIHLSSCFYISIVLHVFFEFIRAVLFTRNFRCR